MLGDFELAAIAVTGLLWTGAVVSLLFRRRRLIRWMLGLAVAATLLTLAYLRAGVGHRA
jgi:hypothetical protein